MKRAEFFWVGLILLLALALRVVSLDADPPNWLSWSAGIYSDEGIYNEDARLLILYHQHMQGDFHISVVAPLHNLLMEGVYHIPKSSLKTVRMVSVIFSIGTLIAFWAMIRQWYGPHTALIALLLLSTSAPYVFYNRLGLLETPALFWLTLGYLCLAKASGSTESDSKIPNPTIDTRQLALAGLFAAIAVAWKGTFVLGALPLLFSAWRVYGKSSLPALTAFLVTIAIYVFVFIVPNYAEYSRDSHYYLFHQYLPHSINGLWFNIRRGLFTGENDGMLPYLFTRSSLPILAGLGYLLLRKQKILSNADSILVLWAAVPIVAMLFCSYTPSRYLVVILPAIVALASCGISSLSNSSVRFGLMGAMLGANIAMFGIWWLDRAYTVRDSSATMQKILPHDTWIAGQFAPELCLNNSLRSMYVQKGLANDNPDTLAILPITHVLATQYKSTDSDPWVGKYDVLIPGPGGLKTLKIGPYTANVYANLNALP